MPNRVKQLFNHTFNPPCIIPSAKKDGKKPKLLMFAAYKEDVTNTFVPMIHSLIDNSTYEIDHLNLANLRMLPKNIDLSKYDGLIFHYTVTYKPITSLYQFDKFSKQKLNNYAGKKILFMQDEYDRLNDRIEFLKQLNFDLVFTLCDQTNIEQFYPKKMFEKTKFISYLTRYVLDDLRNLPYKFEENRPIQVSYRGNKLPYSFGSLAYEKYEIGESFLAHTKQYNLITDISSENSKRLAAVEYFKLLGNSCGVLATESGTSIVDFDGSAEKIINEYLSNNKNASPKELFSTVLAPYENGPQYRAVAPKHFEAAACFAVQLMYEGHYQDIFKPYRHYIPIKKDWSNIEEVMSLFLDPETRKKITEAAYEEIVCNPLYSYEHFVELFDKEVSFLF